MTFSELFLLKFLISKADAFLKTLFRPKSMICGSVDNSFFAFLDILLFLTLPLADSKDNSDFDGVESYVSEMLDNEDYLWIPRLRAICLDMLDNDDEAEKESEELQNSMKNWQTRIEKCLSIVTDIEDKISKKEK